MLSIKGSVMIEVRQTRVPLLNAKEQRRGKGDAAEIWEMSFCFPSWFAVKHIADCHIFVECYHFRDEILCREC